MNAGNNPERMTSAALAKMANIGPGPTVRELSSGNYGGGRHINVDIRPFGK